MRPIYLDYNATSPLAPRVQEAMLPFLAEHFGNPLSDHLLGRPALQAMADARTRVAQAIGAEPDEIYFTSGATESCRWVAQYQDREHITTTVDHWAVRESTARKPQLVQVPPSGKVLPEAVAHAAQGKTCVVSVVHANNELGIVQPVREVSAALDRKHALLHCDAAQSFGKIPVDVSELGVDLLTLASHKCYGPKGAGALYIRRGIDTGPTYCHGMTLSPGTPDVMAIAGFGVAAELAAVSLPESAERMQHLRSRLLEQLTAGAGDQLIEWAADQMRLPNTLAIALPGVTGEQLLGACPEVCATPLASGTPENAQLCQSLKAIQADPSQALGSIRLSLGWYTDQDEVDRAAGLLLDAWERIRDPGSLGA